MRFLIASALLASAAIATPALAQDAPASAPEGKEFQGFKILAVTGIDHVTSSIDNETGLSYGGVIGYDYQAGKAVFGVEYKLAKSEFCPQANAHNFNFLKKKLNLGVWRSPCRRPA